MKRLLALFLLLALRASAQGSGTVPSTTTLQNGPITATSAACLTANSCVWTKLQNGAGTAVVTVIGAFSATLVVEVAADGGNSFTTLATYTTTQVATPFNVAGYTDVRVRATAYASGTASVTLSIGQGAAGTSTVAGSVSITGNVTTTPLNTAGTTDPCANSSVAKLHAFANITTATTTALVPVSGATVVYVCQVTTELNSTVSASTVLFEYGTGAACVGTPTSLSGTYSNSTTNLNAVITIGGGAATAFKTPASNGLCAVSTVGSTPTTPVDVTYVQQ